MNKFSAPALGNNRAFTLIELIAVIMLITIVLAFSLPRLDISFVVDHQRKLSSWIVLNVKSLKENSLREQALYLLQVDFDNQQMWTARDMADKSPSDADTETANAPAGTSQEKETPEPAKYALPEGYRLLDVEFPDDQKIKQGVVTIHFYPKGYSDRAIIHISGDDDKRYSYVIEPFLPHVAIHEEYIEF